MHTQGLAHASSATSVTTTGAASTGVAFFPLMIPKVSSRKTTDKANGPRTLSTPNAASAAQNSSPACTTTDVLVGAGAATVAGVEGADGELRNDERESAPARSGTSAVAVVAARAAAMRLRKRTIVLAG